jgi:uncharacterized damage-inducible protein DinB
MTMIARNFISQFEFNQFTLRRLLDDVSQEDSLQAPKPGVNTVNWLLGHIIATRNRLLKTLSAEGFWGDAEMAMYERGSKNFDPAQATHFVVLRAALETSFEHIQRALPAAEAAFGGASLRKFIRDGETVGDQIGYFICHEEYHVGQIGLIRRLLDKPGLF